MSGLKRLALVAVSTLMLAACGGGTDNTDPRKGRVVIEDTNCMFGSCVSHWKVCIGPDLLIHLYAARETTERTLKDSPECAEPTTTGGTP